MDGLDLLKQDHDKVRELAEQFEQAAEAKDVERMRSLQEEIFTELAVHTAIEEEHLYPATQEMRGLAEITDESVEEHHVVDVLMEEIRGLSPDDDRFAAKMKVLIENVEHHASEEESEMFPKIREQLSQDRLDRLGEELARSKQQQKIERMSREELYAEAQEKQIQGRSDMSKQELAEALGKMEG